MRRKQRTAVRMIRSMSSSICLAGLSLTPVACASYRDTVPTQVAAPPVTVARIANAPGQEIQLVKADGPEKLPDPANAPIADVQPAIHPVFLSLGTIFRLAEGQNSQIALSRARIDEANANKALADKAWMPQISFGTMWWRHEGGITNQDGTLQNSSFGSLLAGGSVAGKFDLKDAIYQKFVAERQLWQQRGEFKKVTTETLLDASNTYIDLLAARSGEAMAHEGKKQLEDLLERAQKAASAMPQAAVEVPRIRAALRARESLIAHLQMEAARASAKLVYLLGIDPSSTIAIADDRLVPLDLIDPNKQVADLVSMALTTGPGIAEMQQMLVLIEEGIARANGPTKYMPIVEMNLIEGGYGTGPGASTSWNNRMDLFLQVRWDITQLFKQEEQKAIMRARTEQANLSSRDLKAKLTAGVAEAWEVVSRGRNELGLNEAAIAESKNAEKLSEERMNARIAGVTFSEIMQSQQATAAARASYLSALRNYNQAQLRLFLLTGSLAPGAPSNHNCASGAVHPE
ncbi:hypothetical protein BH10PLA2_BH10PLA2_10010 [soil metagenome]